MAEYLTTKQVQELLKVDRTTIYRMLKDGRLIGVKVGHQWRFPQPTVDALLSGSLRSTKELSLDAVGFSNGFPIEEIEAVQDVIAESLHVCLFTASSTGKPITRQSNSCRFCNLILTSESGKVACEEHWHHITKNQSPIKDFVTCHAGLNYVRAEIKIEGQGIGYLCAGQFYNHTTEPAEVKSRIEQLANLHNLDSDTLLRESRRINVLNEHERSLIGGWLNKLAYSFQSMVQKRTALMRRLQLIAQMCNLEAE
jgi:excisionase family DNA binding protein